jgi:hypothetical protein
MYQQSEEIMIELDYGDGLAFFQYALNRTKDFPSMDEQVHLDLIADLKKKQRSLEFNGNVAKSTRHHLKEAAKVKIAIEVLEKYYIERKSNGRIR